MSRQTTEMARKTSLSEASMSNQKHQQIEALAYELWLQRGCPVGSDQEDWYKAEKELRTAQSIQRAA